MGWLTGIEPATTGITIRGSTTELQSPLLSPHTKGLRRGNKVLTAPCKAKNDGLAEKNQSLVWSYPFPSAENLLLVSC
jgi:hypothetical protein